MSKSPEEEKIDGSLIKLAEQYASCDRRSAGINDERKTIRDNAEKIGIPSKAFQHAVGMVKQMTTGERRDYQVGINRVLSAISDRQNDLFPVQAERNRKREENRARTGKEGAINSDTNPRSDPNRGGAAQERVASGSEQASATNTAPARPTPPSEAENAAEQEEGENVLAFGGRNAPLVGGQWPDDVAAAKKPSQSEQAAKKRAAALIN
jgi:hypothetical protein